MTVFVLQPLRLQQGNGSKKRRDKKGVVVIKNIQAYNKEKHKNMKRHCGFRGLPKWALASDLIGGAESVKPMAARSFFFKAKVVIELVTISCIQIAASRAAGTN